MKNFFGITGILIFCFSFLLDLNLYSQTEIRLDKNTFGEIKARHIGPASMSGRITSLDAVEKDPRIVYIGTAGGGIWKSENAGITCKPVFDDHNQSTGTITIDQKRPDTVWAGTGEVWVRNSVSVGDGIYKTVNGGKKWKHMGLENSERISKIIIHPEDPDIVYVAVLGALWGDSKDRGVYKTNDGGENWEKILYVDEKTGCADMTMDPDNPDVIIAAMWDFRRTPYFFRSGGEGSALYRTENGGENWEKSHNGLPDETIGRIAVAFSPPEPNVVYALVESEESALYISKDNGKNWEMMNDDPSMGDRPFYFAYLVPDPVDTGRIYKPSYRLQVSDNYGENFTSPSVEGGRVHSDLHAMWIDPSDNQFIYLGTDGGVYVSNDKGNTWRFIRNLPVSTFYHVEVDNQNPYYVYGGLQDNGSWMAPSKNPGGIANKNWDYVGYGDGFNVFRDHSDPNIVYFQSQGGNINRKYMNTNEAKKIKPLKQEDTEELRFNWDTPLVQSPLNKTIYVGAQYLFKSYDQGDTWIRISPDLTTNDKSKQNQENTGGLTTDNSSAENHCTIYTIAESSLDSNILWVGTDDGNLQISRNGGKKWTNVTPNIEGLPPTTWCSSIDPGCFDPAVAYVTFDGHKQGDPTPYVYKTTDFGKTWTSLVDENIEGYCHKILADPFNSNLLFLGTEFGLYISVDDGKNWTRFTGDIPKVSIRDMVIQECANDLIIATHGRGILILDDLTPIRELNTNIINEDLVILNTRPYVISYLGYAINSTGDDEFTGPNPPGSAQIIYYLRKRHLFGDMKIEVFDDEENMIQELTAGKRKGINIVTWSMYKKPPRVPSSAVLLGQAFSGPPLPPGKYKIKITKNQDVYEGSLDVYFDPDSPHSDEDRNLRLDALYQAYDMLEELAFIDAMITDIRDKTKSTAEIIENKEISDDLLHLSGQMDSLKKELMATKQGGITGEKKLREKIANQYGSVLSYQGRPTNSQLERLNSLEAEVYILENKITRITENELKKLNESLSEINHTEISIITKEEFFSEKK